MLRPISRWTMLLAALLCLSAAAPSAQAQTQLTALVSWGMDANGQVSSPSMPGMPTTGSYSAAAAGQWHSVAIRTDGTLISWGDDSVGQVSGTPAGTYLAVAAGDYHSVAIRSDGTLVSWGG